MMKMKLELEGEDLTDLVDALIEITNKVAIGVTVMVKEDTNDGIRYSLTIQQGSKMV